jgi:hypothetical protein
VCQWEARWASERVLRLSHRLSGKKLKLTQAEFAARFHLPLGTVRDWEQGAHLPDKAAQVLLTVIAKDPHAVARALDVIRSPRQPRFCETKPISV